MVLQLNTDVTQQVWKQDIQLYANNGGTTSYYFARKVENKCSNYCSTAYDRCTITIIATINNDLLYAHISVATSSTNPISWLGVI